MVVIERPNPHNPHEGNLGEISSQQSLITHIYKGFAYETHKVTRGNMGDLRLRAYTFEALLNYDVFQTADEIRHHIQPRSGRLVEVIFARTLGSNPRDVGVVTEEVVDVAVGEKAIKVLSIGVKAILPEFRDRNIATQLAIDAIIGHDINVVTGKSRNPRVFRTYQKTNLIEGICPLDRPFPPEASEVLSQVLDVTRFREVDLRTGLCVGIYPPADSRLFIPPKNHEAGMRIFNRLLELGVEPGGRNGIRYYAPVDREAVNVARTAYEATEIPAPRQRSLLRVLCEKMAPFLNLRHQSGIQPSLKKS